ncbi:MAG: hypothetical protein R3C15_19060 [Thermoleophilia bacterium]
MDAWRAFDREVARWRLGEVTDDDLAHAAGVALADGADAPGLVELAIGKGSWEVSAALRRLLAGRGVDLPDEPEAIRLLVVDVAERLEVGTIEPGPALHALWALAWRAIQLPIADDLLPFYLFQEDLDEARGTPAALRDETLAAARELLARWPDRRPGAAG